MGLIPFSDQNLVAMEVDPGLDDAWALMILFGAWKMGLLKIVAIVCSNGNMNLTQSCKNTKKIMDASHITSAQIPLFSGVDTAVVTDIPKDFFFGEDGFGDVVPLIETNPRVILPAIHFAEYVGIVSKRHKKKVTYLSLGSLTFLMTYLLQQPNHDIKDIWIMGGNNLDVNYQEWNFKVDPEAIHFVLRKSKSIPIYLSTFQNCQNVKPTVDWRKNTLGKIQSDIITLMNKAEASKLEKMEDTDVWLQYDPIIAVALAYPKAIAKTEDLKINVTLGSDLTTRSIVVAGDYPVKSIVDLNLNIYKKAYENAAQILG